MDTESEKLLSFIDDHSEESVRFLQGLVQIPSIWGDRPALRGCADYIYQALRSDGCQARVLPSGTRGMPNVLGRLPGWAKGRSVIFQGHIDVYPPSGKWTFGPFDGTVSEGKVYGQGTADMKAGTAAMTMALRLLARSGLRPQGDLFALVVPNHFEGGEGTRVAIRNGLKGDCAIVCEPTGLRVATAQRGILYLKITTHGIPAHTVARHRSVNAIEKMVEVIKALEELEFNEGKEDPLWGPKIMNHAMIQGGLKHNLIPESCTLTVDIRFNPSQTQEGVIRELRQALEVIAATDPKLHYSVQVEDTCVKNPRNPTRISDSEDVVKAVSAAHQAVTGSPGELACHPAWPDAPIFNEAGIVALTYGPGDWACYWPDEYVEVKEYLSAIKVYALSAITLPRRTGG